MKPRIARILPALMIGTLMAVPLTAQVDPQGRSILFIRGAAGTGGATEGGTFTQRTEQLSDVGNLQTNTGNHGWGMLALALALDGFQVSQLLESPVPITTAQLAAHRIVVFGSNNKVYTSAEVAAFHAYIDLGGSALFISDANWGLTWEAAPASDNQFLARYGAQAYQDSGQNPLMSRSEVGRYLDLDHPVLSGPEGAGGPLDVNGFDGEGVSLLRITAGSAGYQAVPIVSAQGLIGRFNNPAGTAGNLLIAGPGDCAMLAVAQGDSRIVAHFDRNTFFNLNGAGTDIFDHDNSQLAMNLFRYLAAQSADVTILPGGCANGFPSVLNATTPVLGTFTTLSLTNAPPNATTLFFVAAGPPQPVLLGSGCIVQVSIPTMFQLPVPTTDATGSWSVPILLPTNHQAAGLTFVMQAVVIQAGGPILGVGELSNGLQIRLGY